MAKERIAVLGAGRMGCGIAEIFCAAGHEVILQDAVSAAREVARGRVREMLALLEQDPRALERVEVTGDIKHAVATADVVIEAVPERLELKREVFSALEAHAPRSALLATNTSALPITHIAESLRTADRIVGLHFWNPPHLVPLVEVVQGAQTAPDRIEQAMRLLDAVGMSPVHVRRDIPGFIGNRLQHALKREAIALVAAGVCDAPTLDRVVRDGFGARLAVLGPLEQSDLVGLDLTLAIHETLIADLDHTPGPHPLLRAKVQAGETGMGAGRGFAEWTPEAAQAVRLRLEQHLVAAARQRLARRTN